VTSLVGPTTSGIIPRSYQRANLIDNSVFQSAARTLSDHGPPCLVHNGVATRYALEYRTLCW